MKMGIYQISRRENNNKTFLLSSHKIFRNTRKIPAFTGMTVIFKLTHYFHENPPTFDRSGTMSSLIHPSG